MDDVLPRPTPDAQLELLKRVQNSQNATEEVSNEFDIK